MPRLASAKGALRQAPSAPAAQSVPALPGLVSIDENSIDLGASSTIAPALATVRKTVAIRTMTVLELYESKLWQRSAVIRSNQYLPESTSGCKAVPGQLLVPFPPGLSCSRDHTEKAPHNCALLANNAGSSFWKKARDECQAPQKSAERLGLD